MKRRSKRVEANRVFKSAPKLGLPSFKFYTHDLNKRLLRIKRWLLTLIKRHNWRKQTKLFDSLAAAALATNAVEIVRQYWFTDRSLVTICSTIAAGLSILVTSILVYKIKRLSTVIITLQRFQTARATTTIFLARTSQIEVIRFSFLRPASTAATLTTATIDKVVEIWFRYKIELIVAGMILAIIIFKILTAVKKFQNRPKRSFQFAIEITDKEQRSLIVRLDTFPGQIMNYHICSQKLIERMEVTGFLRPHLNIIWDVKFFNLNQINGCSTLTGRYPFHTCWPIICVKF